MAGPGIEPGITASQVRCATTKLSRPIAMVHLARTTARTTAFLPPYKVFALENIQDKHKFTLSGLNKYRTGKATAPNVVGISMGGMIKTQFIFKLCSNISFALPLETLRTRQIILKCFAAYRFF